MIPLSPSGFLAPAAAVRAGPSPVCAPHSSLPPTLSLYPYRIAIQRQRFCLPTWSLQNLQESEPRHV